MIKQGGILDAASCEQVRHLGRGRKGRGNTAVCLPGRLVVQGGERVTCCEMRGKTLLLRKVCSFAIFIQCYTLVRHVPSSLAFKICFQSWDPLVLGYANEYIM